jgi:hypothetical protein
VTDENGRPLPNAVLDVDGSQGPVYTADASGTIRCGRWADRTRATLTAPGREERWLSPMSGDRTIALRPSVPVTGRIVDAKGKPRVGAYVWGSRTDAEGGFRIEGKARGTVFPLRFGDYYDSGLATTWWLTVGDPPRTIVDPGSTEVRIRFPADISMDEVYGGAVRLDRPREEPRWSRPRQVEDGVLSLVVPVCPVKVWARAAPGPWQAFTLADLEEGKPVDLDYGASARGQLSGRVVDPEGKPVRGAVIRDVHVPRFEFARTDENGFFRVEDHVGVVPLLVENPRFALQVVDPVDLARSQDIVIRLEKGGRIGGRIQTEAPLKWPQVRILLPHGGATPWCSEIYPDGRIAHFPWLVPAGTRPIEILLPERAPVVKEVEIVEGENDLEVEYP